MPTITVSLEDVYRLLGKNIPFEEFEALLEYVKGEVKAREDDQVSIEMKDTNRPDLWSAEGLSRALKGYARIELGMPKYEARSTDVEVEVDPHLREVRPFIACAVVKGVELDDEAIRQAVQLQEKLDLSYGRKRRKASIGLYDFERISPPIRYCLADPETKFVPLDFEEELTLKEILKKHPKGIQYGHLIAHLPKYPLLVDSEGEVMSMPPIINSATSGKVTPETREVFVEVTGTDFNTVMKTCTIMCTALSERGGKLQSVTVSYPYAESVESPDLSPQRISVGLNYARRIIGMDISVEEAIDALLRARYDVLEHKEGDLLLLAPCYRVDILHPIDVVEDIAIGIGYSNIPPLRPAVPTVGKPLREREILRKVREIAIGLGYQEVLTFTLTSPEKCLNRMRLSGELVETSNPISKEYSCLRSWLLPGLLEFLSKNTHAPYPQKIFEIGPCFELDPSRETGVRRSYHIALVTCHPRANFSEIKSTMDALLKALGVEYGLEEAEHPSFIGGRVGRVTVGGKAVGFIGEIHPEVLEAWNLTMPVSCFELDLSFLLR